MKTINIFTTSAFETNEFTKQTIGKFVNTESQIERFSRGNQQIIEKMEAAGVALCAYSANDIATVYPELYTQFCIAYPDVLMSMIEGQIIFVVNMDVFDTEAADSQLTEHMLLAKWMASGRLVLKSMTDTEWDGQLYVCDEFVQKHMDLIAATHAANIPVVELTYLFTRITPWGNEAYRLVGFKDPRYPFANEKLANFTN